MFRREKEQATLYAAPVFIPLFEQPEQPGTKKTLDFAGFS
jgi:hypothetical protein